MAVSVRKTKAKKDSRTSVHQDSEEGCPRETARLQEAFRQHSGLGPDPHHWAELLRDDRLWVQAGGWCRTLQRRQVIDAQGWALLHMGLSHQSTHCELIRQDSWNEAVAIEWVNL